ncbi:MAG: hypothetical protein Q4D03_00765 [Bacteroidales bacterium]|nr:hypothetical protein [Bacteroidales bacterium]
MKKVIVTIGILGLLTLSGCSKTKTCRCTVLGEQSIRIIELDKGDCKDLHFVYYDRDVLHTDLVDSVLCTDHQWDEN